MIIDEAIELIQKDIDDENIDWDSPLGRAYKLSFEALRKYQGDKKVGCIRSDYFLPSESGSIQ